VFGTSVLVLLGMALLCLSCVGHTLLAPSSSGPSGASSG
jgi:hypothetical protein